MLFFGKKQQQLLGVDIGDDAVRVVALNKRKGGLYLHGYGIATLDQELVVDKNITDTEAVGAVIAQLIDDVLPSYHKNAAVSLPNVAVISKIVQVDAGLTRAELEAQIRLEFSSHFSYPLSEVNLDFVPITSALTNVPVRDIYRNKVTVNDTNDTGNGLNIAEQPTINQPTDQRDVLLVASRTEQVEQRVDALVFAGLTAQVVDVESHTLQRALQYMLGADSNSVIKRSNSALALAQVADTTFTLYVFEGHERIYSREHMWEEDIVVAISHALTFYSSSNTQAVLPTISVLYLGGHALGDYSSWLPKIQDKLSIKVSVANPFVKMACAPHINKQALYDDAPMLLLAFGLALRSAW